MTRDDENKNNNKDEDDDDENGENYENERVGVDIDIDNGHPPPGVVAEGGTVEGAAVAQVPPFVPIAASGTGSTGTCSTPNISMIDQTFDDTSLADDNNSILQGYISRAMFRNENDNVDDDDDNNTFDFSIQILSRDDDDDESTGMQPRGGTDNGKESDDDTDNEFGLGLHLRPSSSSLSLPTLGTQPDQPSPQLQPPPLQQPQRPILAGVGTPEATGGLSQPFLAQVQAQEATAVPHSSHLPEEVAVSPPNRGIGENGSSNNEALLEIVRNVYPNLCPRHATPIVNFFNNIPRSQQEQQQQQAQEQQERHPSFTVDDDDHQPSSSILSQGEVEVPEQPIKKQQDPPEWYLRWSLDSLGYEKDDDDNDHDKNSNNKNKSKNKDDDRQEGGDDDDDDEQDDSDDDRKLPARPTSTRKGRKKYKQQIKKQEKKKKDDDDDDDDDGDDNNNDDDNEKPAARPAKKTKQTIEQNSSSSASLTSNKKRQPNDNRILLPKPSWNYLSDSDDSLESMIDPSKGSSVSPSSCMSETCPICRSESGKKWTVSSGQPYFSHSTLSAQPATSDKYIRKFIQYWNEIRFNRSSLRPSQGQSQGQVQGEEFAEAVGSDEEEGAKDIGDDDDDTMKREEGSGTFDEYCRPVSDSNSVVKSVPPPPLLKLQRQQQQQTKNKKTKKVSMTKSNRQKKQNAKAEKGKQRKDYECDVCRELKRKTGQLGPHECPPTRINEHGEEEMLLREIATQTNYSRDRKKNVYVSEKKDEIRYTLPTYEEEKEAENIRWRRRHERAMRVFTDAERRKIEADNRRHRAAAANVPVPVPVPVSDGVDNPSVQPLSSSRTGNDHPSVAAVASAADSASGATSNIELDSVTHPSLDNVAATATGPAPDFRQNQNNVPFQPRLSQASRRNRQQLLEEFQQQEQQEAEAMRMDIDNHENDIDNDNDNDNNRNDNDNEFDGDVAVGDNNENDENHNDNDITEGNDNNDDDDEWDDIPRYEV